jgi:tetratricopeptide (TPR) repeat protein
MMRRVNYTATLPFVLLLFLFLLCHSSSAKTIQTLEKELEQALEGNSPQLKSKALLLMRATQKHTFSKSTYLVNTALGISYKKACMYSLAQEHFLKANVIAQKLGDKSKIGASFINIATTFQLRGLYQKALGYLKSAIPFLQLNSDKFRRSIAFFNMGEAYKELGKFESALVNFNNTLILEKELKNNRGIIFAYYGLIDTYIQLNRLSDALAMLKQAETLLKPEWTEELVILQKMKGKYYQANAEQDQAILWLNKSFQSASKHNFENHFTELFELLLTSYCFLGNQNQELKVAREFLAFKSQLAKRDAYISEIEIVLRKRLILKDLENKQLKQLNQRERFILNQEKKLSEFNMRFSLFLMITGVLLFLIIKPWKKSITSD